MAELPFQMHSLHFRTPQLLSYRDTTQAGVNLNQNASAGTRATVQFRASLASILVGSSFIHSQQKYIILALL